jgi:hypothetical protein
MLTAEHLEANGAAFRPGDEVPEEWCRLRVCARVGISEFLSFEAGSELRQMSQIILHLA